MRVLFDTNVLYAAFATKGFCEDVVEEAAGACELIWSVALQAELERVLARRSKLGPGTRAALAAYAKLCEMHAAAPLSRPVCRDPDDDLVLAAARAGRADYLVTGDEDLLVLGAWEGIRIVTPRAFWDLVAP